MNRAREGRCICSWAKILGGTCLHPGRLGEDRREIGVVIGERKERAWG